jgi:hypothetical protein
MPRAHEHRYDGFVVGYVPGDWRPSAPLPERYSAPLRALGSSAFDAELVVAGVRVVGAGCTCGWRSVPCIGLGVAHWERSSVYVTQHADAALAALWREHAASFGARAAEL